jgi:DNA-binding transcriptional LysR family regulator
MFEKLLVQQGLSIERLHALLQLSEHGSLIKAAGGDKGKQSRYSHNLRELSAFFGVELTTRVGKVVGLTLAGKALAQIANESFQSLEQFRREACREAPDFRVGGEDGLLQWLVIPAVGRLRRSDSHFRLILRTLRNADVISALSAHQLDFGLAFTNTVKAPLRRSAIATLKYAVVVPERLVAQRGLLTLEQALLDCPHAVVGTDDEISRVAALAQTFGKTFRPEMICDSVAHCVAAVRTGHYAALLPLHSWQRRSPLPCHVIEGTPLERLKQSVALAWHPRTIDIAGPDATRARDALIAVLKGADHLSG